MEELLYEIHGDGVPRLRQNQKLFEESVRFVAHRFGMEQMVHDLQ